MARGTQSAVNFANQERREERRFIARETGTDYVEAVDDFDPRTQNLPDLIAEWLGANGRMTQEVAEAEAAADVATILRKPTDPESDLKRHLLKGLLSSPLYPAARAAAATEGCELVALGLTLAAMDTAKNEAREETKRRRALERERERL